MRRSGTEPRGGSPECRTSSASRSLTSPSGPGRVAGWRPQRRRPTSARPRNVFILSVIGSAVGPGIIWRVPYVAYGGGGGAFLIAHLCALLTAGIPLLFMD
ncbi:hypothetical protein [Microbacterium sp. BR1]|uniref:hypothetical protein n=1 Tax=Microbacterium sp. BR1 TaxID=1070896 RepID=UPI003FA58C40